MRYMYVRATYETHCVCTRITTFTIYNTSIIALQCTCFFFARCSADAYYNTHVKKQLDRFPSKLSQGCQSFVVETKNAYDNNNYCAVHICSYTYICAYETTRNVVVCM